MFGVKAAEPIVKDGVFTGTGEKAEIALAQGAGDPRAISLGGHVAHLKDLIDCIREDRETFMNGAEARSALELIVGIYQSAKTGQRVHFPL